MIDRQRFDLSLAALTTAPPTADRSGRSFAWCAASHGPGGVVLLVWGEDDRAARFRLAIWEQRIRLIAERAERRARRA